MTNKAQAAARSPLHPRNRHQGEYDFARLIAASSDLAPHVIKALSGRPSIDFANAAAVRALNRALLKCDYGIDHWQIPQGYLCPPIPGRADYVHGLADLLAADNAGSIPRGEQVRVLDIGVGANCIYPLIGHREYGWRFLGSDCDARALSAAQANVHGNPGLDRVIELRLQPDRQQIFQGLLAPAETFQLSICNPPFHASLAEVAATNSRKRSNLTRSDTGKARQHRNPAPARQSRSTVSFGGSSGELWCPGGEAEFIDRMIRQSVVFGTRIGWFSSLVSRAEHLARIRARLNACGALEVRCVDMGQGNKRSRFIAWTFMPAAERAPSA